MACSAALLTRSVHDLGHDDLGDLVAVGRPVGVLPFNEKRFRGNHRHALAGAAGGRAVAPGDAPAYVHERPAARGRAAEPGWGACRSTTSHMLHFNIYSQGNATCLYAVANCAPNGRHIGEILLEARPLCDDIRDQLRDHIGKLSVNST